MISPFEFLLALYVILAGLGLTLLIRSVGQIIEARDRIQLYWIHSAWVTFIFIAHLTSWFVFWHFRHVESWTIAKFLLLISVPTVLYLVSHISVPEVYSGDDRKYDLREHFYTRFRAIFCLLALTMILNFIGEWALLGSPRLNSLNVMRATALAALLLGLISNNPRLHAGIVGVITMVFISGLTVLPAALN